MAEGKAAKRGASTRRSTKKTAPARPPVTAPTVSQPVRSWNEIHPIDASFLDHHIELASRSAGADLCDCWVTIGLDGKWYPSVDKQWCRNQGQVGSGAVGHIYKVGTARRFPDDPDGQSDEG
jgi:hypothetical protein